MFGILLTALAAVSMLGARDWRPRQQRYRRRWSDVV